MHRIVMTLTDSLGALGSPASALEIEKWGFALNGAIASASRQFHNHDHVLELAAEGDALAKIAALYHDAVYIQVDHGPPHALKAEVESVLAPDAAGWRVLPAAGGEATRDVLAVFDRRVGDVATPMTGLNELASALVASMHLASALDRTQRVAVAACIEQTIPFRADGVTPLRGRLEKLGLSGEELTQAMHRAVDLANRDVGSFAEDDPARFLDSTWKLLPESNPALHVPSVHTVRDYRVALQKMEGFLASLAPERVFHRWEGVPSEAAHAERVARTRSNVAIGAAYLRAKLFSIAIVEAIAEVTGGDVPLDYFMGGVASPNGPALVRIEQFLPALPRASDVEPLLHRLLAEGRASEVSFDTGASPLGAFLHAAVGDGGVARGVDHARRWWSGGCSAGDFLEGLPAAPVAALARAAANIVGSRRDGLTALADRLAAQA